jgi:uncharacterized Zn-binding protein involved in type VI secretion
MSLPAARMSDTGFGDDTCHDSTKHGVTGIIIQGAPTVMTNGLPLARMSDIVMRGDGHSGIIIGGSGTVIASGLPVARMSDQFIGCFTGIIIGGASNVVAGG